jgi:hypothetical protein
MHEGVDLAPWWEEGARRLHVLLAFGRKEENRLADFLCCSSRSRRRGLAGFICCCLCVGGRRGLVSLLLAAAHPRRERGARIREGKGQLPLLLTTVTSP